MTSVKDILKPHITGFYNGRNFKEFIEHDRSLVQDLEQVLGTHKSLDLVKTIEAELDDNYFKLLIKDKKQNKAYTIFINALYPYAATEGRGSKWFNLKFDDAPEALVQVLEKLQIQLLSKSQLETEVTEADLQNLERIELDQIKKANASSLGHIVFNGWE